MCCLCGEIDSAGHADALEFPPLLSSDEIAADVELSQRPLITETTADIRAFTNAISRLYLSTVVIFMLPTVLAGRSCREEPLVGLKPVISGRA
jgi:hypothetical protein